jgi:hypothetical protein
MGMSTHVIGFRPPDEQWRKMKAVYDACKAAGTEAPRSVIEFFNDEEPDDNGQSADIKAATRPYQDDSREGIEVDITKLPQGLKIVRFYNSW